MEIGGEHRDIPLLLSIPKPLLLSLTAHTFFPKDQFIAQNKRCVHFSPKTVQPVFRITDTDVRVPGP